MEIRRIEKGSISEFALDGFERTQPVERVYRQIEGEYRLADEPYTMDWSLERKREVAASLMDDEFVSFGAFEGDALIGFVSVEGKLRGDRLVLDIIQVDRSYRRKGLGRTLFSLAIDQARILGARRLYLSACSSEDTVSFYRAMGLRITADPIPEIAESEPMDVQMEMDVQ